MYHLVHANIAIVRAPWDDPRMAGFVAKMDEIDALAQGCPEYVAQPIPPDEGSVYAGVRHYSSSMASPKEKNR